MSNDNIFTLNMTYSKGNGDTVRFFVGADSVRIWGADWAGCAAERNDTVSLEAARAEWKKLIAEGYKLG